MKELNRANIRNDLIEAIMKINNWNADLRLAVISEIYPQNEPKKHNKKTN